MPVTRSAFASRAACSAISARRALSPSFPRRRESMNTAFSEPEPPCSWTPDCAGGTEGWTTPSSTSQRAGFATRSTLSATVPSFSWKTIWSSLPAKSASFVFLSCSQKNFASASRAASTFSLPATIALPPSFASMLATQMKLGASFPVEEYLKAKYFWFTRMVRSEEHTSELQSLMRISYDVFCLKKKKNKTHKQTKTINLMRKHNIIVPKHNIAKYTMIATVMTYHKLDNSTTKTTTHNSCRYYTPNYEMNQ